MRKLFTTRTGVKINHGGVRATGLGSDIWTSHSTSPTLEYQHKMYSHLIESL